jgi:hypothetical protein
MHVIEITFVTMMIAHDLSFPLRSTGGGATCVLKQPHNSAGMPLAISRWMKSL